MQSRFLFALFALIPLCSNVLAGDKAVIVLDASGSMWGQIQGKTKIEVARETLEAVLGSVPEDLSLGLVAYGHRRKGDCADIELLVPPTTGSGAGISSAANRLKPKGKTPLSASVVQAAETLKYTEDKATVILITDGLETCEKDPCAVGASLAAAGVDFTAHVVGFGLSEEEGRQVACLAENTGGMYLQASDADQLGEALAQTVAVAVEPEPKPKPDVPPPPRASLSAEDTVDQAAMFPVTWDGPGDRYDSIQIFDPQALNGEGKVVRSATLAHGDKEKRQVTMAAPAKVGGFLLRYWDGRGRRAIATRPIEVIETSVSLSAPQSVEMGRPIKIEWQGPGERYDSIQIYDPTAMQGEGKRLRDKRLRNDDFENRRVTMPAPAKAGTYELRYWNGDNKAVLLTRSIEVLAVEVSLSAPESVGQAGSISVEWVGPGGRYDAIQLYDPSAGGGEGKRVREKRLRNDDFENRKASLAAPAKPGDYELRYWNGDNKAVLATRAIAVAETEVALAAPDGVPAGDFFVVDWVGPGARYDEVRIVDGDGKTTGRRRLRNAAFEERKVEIKAPKEPGQYELRYWNGENKAVLATRALRVE